MLVPQSCLTHWDPMDCSPPGSSCNSPGKNTGVGSHALLQGNLLNPRIKPGSPTLQADSLPSEPSLKISLKTQILALCACCCWDNVQALSVVRTGKYMCVYTQSYM